MSEISMNEPVTPSKQRSSLLEAAEKAQYLKKLISRHLKKTDNFNLKEIVESLSSSQHRTLWTSLLTLVTESVVDLSEDADNLHSVAVIASVYIECGVEVEELVSTVKLIHNHLLEFGDKDSYTQNYCCSVLEQYWLKDLPDRNYLAVYVPPYLLARLGCSIGKLRDVGRLNKVCAMLKLIDFKNQSSQSLVHLLCSSITNTMFFKTNDGLNCLSSVMVLDPQLLQCMDTALKSVLADFNDTQLTQAGNLYIKLWEKVSGNPELSPLYKSHCVQGLVEAAINCHRTGPLKAAPQIQKVLSVLHKYKQNDPILEQMLYDLYRPVLYADLHVANGDVRANAATLFLSVFPLVEPSWSKVVFEGALEEQCIIIKNLLVDDSEQVRVCAVRGVAKIMDNFWEVLPSAQAKELLVLLCCEMTMDMNSSDVVVAALQGIQLLLNNPLIHVSLNKLLPVLENHIYHPSSNIRAAFVSLLLTVNQTNSIKFWHIVKAEDLLTALSTSKTGVIRRRLVSLLAPSYFPTSQPLSTQLLVALSMLRSHPNLHRLFYDEVYEHVDMSDALKFVVMVLRVVSECVESGGIELEDENMSRLELSDLDMMNKMLEICALLIRASAKDVASNPKAAAALCAKTVNIMPRLLEHFTNPTSKDALVTLLCHLPKEGLKSLKKMCIKLCEEEHAVSSAYLALIRSGRSMLVVEYITEGIAERLKRISGSRKASLNGSDDIDMSKSRGSSDGLQTLTILLEEGDELLKCDLTELCTTLGQAVNVIETCTESSLSVRGDHVKYLAECVAMFVRLQLHNENEEGGDVALVAEWLHKIIKDKQSSDTIRSCVIKAIYPILVEVTQITPYTPILLSSLILITSNLARSELMMLRVSVCKLLVIAGNLVANNQVKDIDLRPLLIRVLTEVSKDCLLNRTVTVKSLCDIQALLIEVGIMLEKHIVLQLTSHPWEGCMVEVAALIHKSIQEQVNSIEEKELEAADFDSFNQCVLSSVQLSKSLEKHLLLEMKSLSGTESWCRLAENYG